MISPALTIYLLGVGFVSYIVYQKFALIGGKKNLNVFFGLCWLWPLIFGLWALLEICGIDIESFNEKR